ncbi:MAG: hypothetical protein CG441_825, partial [Methylococcaceae bacterium NSM2-1]
SATMGGVGLSSPCFTQAILNNASILLVVANGLVLIAACFLFANIVK